ncbi:MAG TPA: hypothetical protein PKM21_05305 [Anaerolineales bacterium]|nr:hypothetical protein [Anaerolineales bacterium]
MLTIFTTPKPFTNPHINLIQRNAIQSWLQMEADVQVLVIGQEAGLAEACQALQESVPGKLRHLPDVARNIQGTPLVSSIFEMARQAAGPQSLLAYVNADVILLPDFLQAAAQVAGQAEKFLIVGQRWDLDVQQPIDFSPGWQARLQEDVRQRGRLHPPGGSDYFIFPSQCFTAMPAFAIGRAGWDNWMFFHGRQQGWPVIDATQAIQVIHQDHDYSHLPNGQPHYRLPETTENVRLAGGRRTIFTLADANYQLKDKRIQPIPRRGAGLWREIETLPLRRWKSIPLAELTFAIFHPVKAWREWRAKISWKLKHL